MSQIESPTEKKLHWDKVTNLDSKRKLGSPLQREAWKGELLKALRETGDVTVRCNICKQFTMKMKITKSDRPFAHCTACWIQIHVRSSPVMEWLLEETCQVAIDAMHEVQAHGG